MWYAAIICKLMSYEKKRSNTYSFIYSTYVFTFISFSNFGFCFCLLSIGCFCYYFFVCYLAYSRLSALSRIFTHYRYLFFSHLFSLLALTPVIRTTRLLWENFHSLSLCRFHSSLLSSRPYTGHSFCSSYEEPIVMFQLKKRWVRALNIWAQLNNFLSFI